MNGPSPIANNDRHIYVAARAHDSDPGGLIDGLSRLLRTRSQRVWEEVTCAC